MAKGKFERKYSTYILLPHKSKKLLSTECFALKIEKRLAIYLSKINSRWTHRENSWNYNNKKEYRFLLAQINWRHFPWSDSKMVEFWFWGRVAIFDNLAFAIENGILAKKLLCNFLKWQTDRDKKIAISLNLLLKITHDTNILFKKTLFSNNICELAIFCLAKCYFIILHSISRISKVIEDYVMKET